MNCPKCRLVSPPSAQRCDCGYDFNLNRMERPYIADARLEPGSPAVGVIAGLFGLIGVGLVYALSRSSTTRTSAWIGFALKLVITILILLATK